MKIKKQKPISERDNQILEMRRAQKTIIEIGSYFNISKQRVWTILKKYGDTACVDLPIDKGS